MAQRLADLALEVAHAGFARVVRDDLAQRRLGDLDLAVLDAVRLHLALDQIALGDLQLLDVGVAGEADDLHAVAQRPRDGVEHVRRGDEHHARQVVGHAEIVVAERVVLLRVQHLEQAADGSPWMPAPSLSISSSIITQLREPALRMPWMMLPGSAPI